MRVDWSADIGADAPCIELPWEGWVDLDGAGIEAVRNLPEIRAYPELLALLHAANGRDTVSTKVDVFPISRDEVDPEITEDGEAAIGLGSYLDLLPRHTAAFRGYPDFEQLVKAICARLQGPEPRQAGGEIVLRAGRLYDEETFGWTLYAFGFGRDLSAARMVWHRAATAITDAFSAQMTHFLRLQAREPVGE